MYRVIIIYDDIFVVVRFLHFFFVVVIFKFDGSVEV